MKNIILGAHSLSSMFSIKQPLMLKNAMRATVNAGGKMLEMPFLLLGPKIPWEVVGKMAKKEGLEEMALCHFWPKNKDGSSVCGDPLGNELEVRQSLETMGRIISAIQTLRTCGLRVRFIDGPTWGGLGWDYINLLPEQKIERAASFLQKAGDMCASAAVILAVEFLRPVEDKVVGGTRQLLSLLIKVNRPQVVMAHFDVFHSVECGENPAESIRLANRSIAYLHLHGDKRIAPGAKGDKRDWPGIVEAIHTIDSGVNEIPGLPEPFGEATCKENKELGAGLPIPPPLPKYLKIAYRTLRGAGLRVGS